MVISTPNFSECAQRECTNVATPFGWLFLSPNFQSASKLNVLMLEVFTLLHEFLRIPPDSQWKVGILRNSMEFLWKAFGWSLSHLGFLFHGNSNFFPRNSDGNGWNPGASGNDSQWNPWDSVGIPLKFRWNSMGNSLIVIVKNSTIVKNRTLASATHHVRERKSILAVALYDC